jgi:polysaccharide pyruvyl transferase WcaK-like protein
MAGFISTLDLVVGHRLHACVAAYSYGVPHIGFTWDIKMRSFFESVGRARFLCEAVVISVPEVVALGEETMRAGIDTAARDAVIADTHGDIAAMLRDLLAAPGA